MTRRTVLVAALAATAAGIGPGGLLAPAAPRAAYVTMLLRTGLSESVDARAWLRAADAVLDAAEAEAPPFRRTVALGPAAGGGSALGYRVTVPQGRRLSIAVAFDAAAPGARDPAALVSSPAPAPAPLFVDLFRVGPDERPALVASLPAGRRSLVHDVEAAGDYIVRAQAELAASGRATVAIRTLASLPFPVADVPRGMQSGFGVDRDAGRRQHQGIDIFAPRGTPVRAVAGGIARAGSNRLGGTVVWVHAPAGGRTYYYAHLDRQAVGAVAMVAAGDVIGYVGNTGNARTTPPHLHFGIYDGGAVDPWPFVQPDQAVPGPAGPDPPGPRDRPARQDRTPRPVSSRGRPRRRSARRRRA
jgi:murein DD-endopeptidase MepM/ murein hydrolase activator NlpD